MGDVRQIEEPAKPAQRQEWLPVEDKDPIGPRGIIELSARDSARITEALLNHRPLTPELRDLLAEHAERVEQR